MTFLELVQRLRQEAGLPGTGPSTVTGQVGRLKELVDWTAQAYVDIQQDRQGQWKWLRRPFTFDTTASDGIYAFGDVTDTLAGTAITRFSKWRIKDRLIPPKIYLQSAGVGTQRWLHYMGYEPHQLLYSIGTQNNGAPAYITIDPQDNIVLGPVPNDVYTITGEYLRGPQTLAADGEEPEMPEQFHMAIVFRALIEYGYDQVAEEKLLRAERRHAEIQNKLSMNQGEHMRFRMAGPLA